MTELATQQDYWNSRANQWEDYGVPLIPDEKDVEFMRSQIKPGGDTLVLGATPQLCQIALESSARVTSVDFAKDVIEALRIKDVEYKCANWNQFFEEEARQFDNIMTDGGLLCLGFPSDWKKLAENIHSHLITGGIFTARVYMSTEESPRDDYDNPNLARFMSGAGKVDENWMLDVQTHDDYSEYEVRYALPPEREVIKVFGKFALKDTLLPEYEEGERFKSFAWEKV